jgi:hypothetical protein
MITLDAVVTKDQLDGEFTWDDIPTWALRYECFLGDIRFEVDKVDFSTHWGWVPVLDFALGMSNLLNALEHDSEQTFEFTESEAVIRIRRTDGIVELTTSYSPGVMRVDVGELREATRDLAQRLGTRFGSEHPALANNEEFQAALRQVGAA